MGPLTLAGSVRDARVHMMTPPQTNATPITSEPIPRALAMLGAIKNTNSQAGLLPVADELVHCRFSAPRLHGLDRVARSLALT